MKDQELDKFIICQKCYTLHEIIVLGDGGVACCSRCGSVLYRKHKSLVDKGLALTITALIFFIIANIFPIVTIDMQGNIQSITLPFVLFTLFDDNFFLVAILCSFVIFIFPLILMLLLLIILLVFKLKRGRCLSKRLLVLLAHILPWNMSEVFLISILVALVKMIGYAQIEFGIAFGALSVFVALEIYITKNISLYELWSLRNETLYE